MLLIAAGGVAIRRATLSLDEPLHVAGSVRFKVPPGVSFARIAAELGREGVVPQPRAWVLYARWRGVASAVKAGEYEIEPGLTPRTLLEKMVSGQVLLHSLTIVDGWRVKELLAAMRRNADIVSTVPAEAAAADLMQRLGVSGMSAEGQFLPETYRFPSGTADLDLLRQSHAALTRVLDAAWAGRDPRLPLQSANDLLVMASIVQKESGLPEELPKIAGLYLHRFSIGMRLQADPTVIYGLGGDGELHSVDLRTDGPYNTYTRVGLPPTPIALAGAAAIMATAHPVNTDALYFVASDKGDGSHVFSATLEQHNAAVARYVSWLRRKPSAEAVR